METASEHRSDTVTTHRWGWPLFVAILVGIGYLFSQVHGVKESQFQQAPLVVADPSKLDFGERWEGEEFTWTVPIRNTTDRPIEVTEFSTSCTCTTVEPKQLRWEAGQTANVTLTIRPVIDARKQTDLTTQIVSLLGYGADRKTILLSAFVWGRPRQLVEFDPPEVSFSQPLVRGVESATVRVSIRPEVTGQTVRVVPDPDIRALLEANGGDYELRVSVKPKLAGNWSGSVRVELLGADAKLVAAKDLVITANVVQPVVAVPSRFDFGVVPVGEMAEVNVVLKPTSATTFSVEGWTSSDGVQTRAEAERFSYRLRLPIRGGEQSAVVTFRSRLENGEELPIKLTLSAFGRE